MSQDPRELRDQAAGLNNAQINATARFWWLCEAQEKGENQDADRILLTGLVGRRIVRLMFGVLLKEVAREPGMFTPLVAALANGMVREVGESLQAFPFEERVRAFEGLSRELAAGLEIALAPAPKPQDPS